PSSGSSRSRPPSGTTWTGTRRAASRCARYVARSMPSSARACSTGAVTWLCSSAFAVARTSIALSSCWSSSSPAPRVLETAATCVAPAASSAKNDAPGRGWALPASAAARVIARAEEMRTCETARARRPSGLGVSAAGASGAGVSGAGVSGAPTAAPPSSSVVLTARSRASCPTTGLRPPCAGSARRRAPTSRACTTPPGVPHATVPSSAYRTPPPPGSHPCLMFARDNPCMSTPTRRRRSPSRTLALGAALAAVVALAGCAEDGSVSVPEFTLTGDQVQQFLDDARSQAETIGDDVRSLADEIGSLSEDARPRAEEAVAAAQDAAEEARAAADDAATATEDTRAEAQQRLADAEAALDDASDRLGEVADSLTGADAAVRDALERLRTRVDELRADLDGSTGS